MDQQLGQRLEQIMVTLASQQAPQLLPRWDRQGDYDQRLPKLARALADYNLLVIMGDPPYSLRGLTDDIRQQIQSWVNGYGQLYGLLTKALFPSYTSITAHYTDDKWPVIIYMRGDALPVIQHLAGYVAPFIVQRQLSPVISEVELVGLMDSILDDLEASTLPRDAYKKLRADGVAILKQMLAAQIQQLALTEFDRPLFTDSQRIIPVRVEAPVKLPEEDSQVTKPEQLLYSPPDTSRLTPTQTIYSTPDVKDAPASAPGAKQAQADNAEQKSFGSSIPIFFTRKDSNRKARRPPLPPLPGSRKRE